MGWLPEDWRAQVSVHLLQLAVGAVAAALVLFVWSDSDKVIQAQAHRLWSSRPILATSVVALIGALLTAFAFILYAQRPPVAAAQVWVRCNDQIQIPKIVPSEGHVYFLGFPDHFYKLTGVPDSRLGMPFWHGEPGFSYQCVVSNKASVPLRDVRLSLQIISRAVIKVDDKGSSQSGKPSGEPQQRDVQIDEIAAAPGGTVPLYVYNVGNEWADMDFVNQGSAILGTENTPRPIQIVVLGRVAGLPPMVLPPFTRPK